MEFAYGSLESLTAMKDVVLSFTKEKMQVALGSGVAGLGVFLTDALEFLDKIVYNELLIGDFFASTCEALGRTFACNRECSDSARLFSDILCDILVNKQQDVTTMLLETRLLENILEKFVIDTVYKINCIGTLWTVEPQEDKIFQRQSIEAGPLINAGKVVSYPGAMRTVWKVETPIIVSSLPQFNLREPQDIKTTMENMEKYTVTTKVLDPTTKAVKVLHLRLVLPTDMGRKIIAENIRDPGPLLPSTMAHMTLTNLPLKSLDEYFAKTTTYMLMDGKSAHLKLHDLAMKIINILAKRIEENKAYKGVCTNTLKKFQKMPILRCPSKITYTERGNYNKFTRNTSGRAYKKTTNGTDCLEIVASGKVWQRVDGYERDELLVRAETISQRFNDALTRGQLEFSEHDVNIWFEPSKLLEKLGGQIKSSKEASDAFTFEKGRIFEKMVVYANSGYYRPVITPEDYIRAIIVEPLQNELISDMVWNPLTIGKQLTQNDLLGQVLLEMASRLRTKSMFDVFNEWIVSGAKQNIEVLKSVLLTKAQPTNLEPQSMIGKGVAKLSDDLTRGFTEDLLFGEDGLLTEKSDCKKCLK